jgi:hypothetical protein
MKVYNSLASLIKGYKKAEVPECILKEAASLVRQMLDTDAEGTAELLTMREVEETLDLLGEELTDDFELNSGGKIFICETEEDLKQVKTCSWCEPESCYLDITQTVATCDGCWYLYNKEDTGWGCYFLATNNAGGPAYYIPAKLWDACKFKEQLKVTNEHWDK